MIIKIEVLSKQFRTEEVETTALDQVDLEVAQGEFTSIMTDLRLNVAHNDTTITEQLNNLTNISNGLETTKLVTERQLIDIEFRIKVLQRQKNRWEQLVNDSLVSKEEYETIVDELEYQEKVLANTQTRQELENKIRVERIVQIATQIDKLNENLEVSQISFENLLVRAPIAGQLTSLPVDIG